jgi:hypothetical protein
VYCDYHLKLLEQDSIWCATHSHPLSSTQINLFPLLQIIHNVVNTPGLELVAFRIVLRNVLIVFQSDAVLEILNALVVVLVRVPFGVVLPDPLG